MLLLIARSTYRHGGGCWDFVGEISTPEEANEAILKGVREERFHLKQDGGGTYFYLLSEEHYALKGKQWLVDPTQIDEWSYHPYPEGVAEILQPY